MSVLSFVAALVLMVNFNKTSNRSTGMDLPPTYSGSEYEESDEEQEEQDKDQEAEQQKDGAETEKVTTEGTPNASLVANAGEEEAEADADAGEGGEEEQEELFECEKDCGFVGNFDEVLLSLVCL